MCFKIMSKVVKYTCRLHRYDYTHDQLNTRQCITIFYKFFEGGAPNLSLSPGARYPRYAIVIHYTIITNDNTKQHIKSSNPRSNSARKRVY